MPEQRHTAPLKDTGHQIASSLFLAGSEATDQRAGRAGKIHASMHEAHLALSLHR